MDEVKYAVRETPRNQSLDVLRGIAVLMVICHHAQLFPVMGAGWAGVDLFFVLSGFLISGLLFSDIQQFGKIRIGRFLFRRGMKIYPAFYFYLLITVLLLPGARSAFWTEAVFLQNYAILANPGLLTGKLLAWGHLWSLAVEEHFYIALPLLLIGLNRIGKLSLIPKLSAVLIAACFLERIREGSSHYPYTAWETGPTHLRVDSLFAGVALAYLFHFERERFLRTSRKWLPIISAIFMLPVLITRDSMTSALVLSFVISSNLIAFASLVLWAIPRRVPFGLGAVRWLGKYSYSIYLWHVLPVYLVFTGKPDSIIHFGVKLAVSLLIGIAMAHLVEIPTLAFRERFFRVEHRTMILPALALPAEATE